MIVQQVDDVQKQHIDDHVRHIVQMRRHEHHVHQGHQHVIIEHGVVHHIVIQVVQHIVLHLERVQRRLNDEFVKLGL